MPDVGDYTTPRLLVTPFDGTTAATLTVHAPDGTTSNPVPSTTDGGHTWATSPVALNAAGWWLLTWTVAGVGAGSENQRIFVDAAPSGPSWAPDLPRVADYIPQRTLVGAVDGYGSPADSFTPDTHPTDAQVTRLIAEACTWVTTRTGTIDASLVDSATSCAALRTAGMVELAYPDTSRDAGVATELLRQADAMRTDLAKANEAITGDDPEDPAAHLLPLWSFPAADPNGDLEFS